MNRKEDELVISALATYICVQARKRNIFIREVEVRELADKLDATSSTIEKAETMARNILREFI